MPNLSPATAEPASAIPFTIEKMREIEGLFAAVPDAGDEGLASIVDAILSAEDLAELDDPWQSDSLGKRAGHVLRIDRIRKAPSSFAGGLPYFLIIQGVDETTGEIFAATTSSVVTVLQLAKALTLAELPIRVRPVISERPTRSGYYPQRLEFVG
jgi:hypothetical protein